MHDHGHGHDHDHDHDHDLGNDRIGCQGEDGRMWQYSHQKTQEKKCSKITEEKVHFPTNFKVIYKEKNYNNIQS